MGNETLVSARILQEADMVEALTYIHRKAHERYDCAPPPQLPTLMFGAYRGSKIVGTVGIDFGDQDRPFPLENTWTFDHSKTPFPFNRSQVIQYGRWMAEPGIGMALLGSATRYAISQGKLFFLVEAHKVIRDLVARGGCSLKPIPGARLSLEKVPTDGRKYYLKESPLLCMERLTMLLQATIST